MVQFLGPENDIMGERYLMEELSIEENVDKLEKIITETFESGQEMLDKKLERMENQTLILKKKERELIANLEKHNEMVPKHEALRINICEPEMIIEQKN